MWSESRLMFAGVKSMNRDGQSVVFCTGNESRKYDVQKAPCKKYTYNNVVGEF